MSTKTRTGLTELLARACAGHPLLALTGWALAVVVSFFLIATALDFNDDADFTGRPESIKAGAIFDRTFPPTAQEQRQAATDVIVVTSARYTVDAPLFRHVVTTVAGGAIATGPGVLSIRTYLNGDRSLVSPNRHTTVIPLQVADDPDIEPVVSLVRSTSWPDFSVAVTGDRTTSNDFDLLSQEDLEKGELQFGLPAALIILLLVFGAVVAGLVPCSWRSSRSSSRSGSSR